MSLVSVLILQEVYQPIVANHHPLLLIVPSYKATISSHKQIAHVGLLL